MSVKRQLRSVRPQDSNAAPITTATATATVTREPEPAPAAIVAGEAILEVQTSEGQPIQAIIPVSAGSVVVAGQTPTQTSSGLIGDWDQSDVKFPSLKIVQGSGQLSQQWGTGTLLLGDEELMPPPDLRSPKPEHVIRFVPIVLQKQWRENLTQEEAASGQMPRTVDTLAEVHALGGTTEWINDQRPSWGPSAKCLLLIERPLNLPGSGTDHPGFALEMDGQHYAPALYYAAGTAWTHFGKVLYNVAKTTLLVPQLDAEGKPVRTSNGVIVRSVYLPKNIWEFRVTRKPAGDYMVFAPEVRLTRTETGPEIRAFVDTLRA